MKNPDVILIDLDGTLADIEHRVGMIKKSKPDWDGFFKSCIDDIPQEWCVRLIRSLIGSGYKVFIVSARSKVVEKETIDWIRTVSNLREEYDSGALKLMMIREVGDYTPDHILKMRWLDGSGLEGRILFVVDDRTRMVDAWRSRGLTVLQCQRWEEWKKPKKLLNDVVINHGAGVSNPLDGDIVLTAGEPDHGEI